MQWGAPCCRGVWHFVQVQLPQYDWPMLLKGEAQCSVTRKGETHTVVWCVQQWVCMPSTDGAVWGLGVGKLGHGKSCQGLVYP